jgi:hypothetical protein
MEFNQNVPASSAVAGLSSVGLARSGGLRRIFSYPVALATGLITVTSLSAFTRLGDPDLWWHLKLGQTIWNTDAIPTTDQFSFTAFGHPWVAHEWLSQVSLYAAYRLAGYSGLVLWIALVGSLTYLAIYLLCWRVSHNSLVALRGGIVAFCFGSVGLGPRPLLLGNLLLAAELVVLELARTRRVRWLWLLPPLFAIWVNCHGSWIFGMAVLAVYFACCFRRTGFGPFLDEKLPLDFRRRLGWTMAGCAAAVFVNPAGYRLVLYPLNLLFSQKTNLSSIEEWLPPSLADGNTWVLLAAMGAVLLLAAARRLSLREVVLVVMATIPALEHRRMLFLFGLLTAPVLAHYGWGRERKRSNPVADAVLIFGCLAAMIWIFPGESKLREQVASRNPAGAVRYIRQAGLRQPMLNEYRFGGYLLWALPENKVFIDGRTDIFDWTGVLADYVRWVNLADDPEALLNKYRIGFCLLERSSGVAHLMPYLPGWRKAYEDGLAVVFIRDDSNGARTGDTKTQ